VSFFLAPLQSIVTDMNEVKNGIASVAKTLETLEQVEGDQFRPIFTTFHEQASTQFSELEKRLKIMEDAFKEVLVLFGEDTDKAQPEEFFATMKTFAQLFEQAKKQNEDRARQEEAQRKRQEAADEKEAKRVAKEQAAKEKAAAKKDPALEQLDQNGLPPTFSFLFR